MDERAILAQPVIDDAGADIDPDEELHIRLLAASPRLLDAVVAAVAAVPTSKPAGPQDERALTDAELARKKRERWLVERDTAA